MIQCLSWKQPLLCLFLIIVCYGLAHADAERTTARTESSFSAVEWKADTYDQRRAVPNDASPPARKMPQTLLQPLGRESVGTIRRVELPAKEKVVALTFDMCELATSTSGCDMEILQLLHEKSIPATLFMGGKWMRTHARRAMQIMREPLFEIGNHGWTHGNCALLSVQGVRAQVLWTQAQYELLREVVLRRTLEKGEPAPAMAPVPTLFRLPYGRCTAAALEEIARLGLRVVQWDVVAESGDARQPSRARHMAQHVAAQVKPGSILLFHANGVPKGSAQLLREMVAVLQAKGYRFVTAGALLRMGRPQMAMDGYFTCPGDNRALDRRFGVDGTGLRTPFTGD